MTSPLDDLPPEKLAHLLNPESMRQLSADNTSEIFLHQLRAPLLPDLATVPGADPVRLKALLTNRPGTQSFFEQLTTPYPSLEILQAIKDFARHAQSDPVHPLHGDTANLVYCTAIAAAILRLNTHITQLTTAQLREGFAWSLAHPASDPVRHIVSEAAAML